jgi:hemolysin activation/secretion protein
VGRAGEDFKGRTWKAGGELYATVLQHKKFFTDVLGGGRYEHLTTNNETVEVKGNVDLFFPYLGCRYEHHGDVTNLQGRLTLEWTRSDYTDTNVEELTKMGRLDPSQNWFTLRWDMTQAAFLEPILNRQEWEDTSQSATMAHEVFFGFRGQSTFDRRVIPQHQMVVGGAYSVRGYPEAVAVGDSAAVGTLEYRFHLPRSFGVEPDPSRTPLLGAPFRFAPQSVYGRPDWDLVLRAFFDAGWTFVADPLVFEKDEALYGTGLGLEFMFKNNLSLRADFGVALSDVRKDTPMEVESGNNELHLTFTVLF